MVERIWCSFSYEMELNRGKKVDTHRCNMYVYSEFDGVNG